MGRINVAILDSDTEYVEAISTYLESNYRNKFIITYFTEVKFLEEAMLVEARGIDVLLVCLEHYSEAVKCKEINTVILLSHNKANNKYQDGNPDKYPDEYTNIDWVYKYSTGDILANRIVDSFLKRDPGKIGTSNGERNASVTAIYSPSGGTGKTAISIALSMISAKRGRRTLYLSFEQIQSTQLFFECGEEKTFSHLALLLKQKSKNLIYKIENLKSMDPHYNLIHYFYPPECALDIEALTDDEIKHLILALKSSSCYDEIIIDMSSDFNLKNIALMKEADKVLFIITPDIISVQKYKGLKNELEILQKSKDCDIISKAKVVLNRYLSKTPMDNNEKIFRDIKIDYTLPEVKNLVIPRDERYMINTNNDFGNAISELALRI